MIETWVLIVEDDLDIQEMISSYLKDEGFEITCVNDGQEALSLLALTQ